MIDHTVNFFIKNYMHAMNSNLCDPRLFKAVLFKWLIYLMLLFIDFWVLVEWEVNHLMDPGHYEVLLLFL